MEIRNFSIISHVDHGKSTLADRMLELTHTVEPRRMRSQVLDGMDLERERGITIKMTPVRMLWHPHGRRTTPKHSKLAMVQAQADTQTHADNSRADEDFLYKEITYKIRGAAFAVRKQLGLGHKESVYHKALEIELKKQGLGCESEETVPIYYDGANIGAYRPDFIVERKVLVELKSLPEIGKPQQEQVWSYLKGSDYRLALLINFGSKDVNIRRVVYDTAREARLLRSSASRQRESAQVQDEYILNLIDTPGHVDFAYEVSRALSAVEGVVLLVDATQGVEAQTLSVLSVAQQLRLAVIPVVSKCDAPNARIETIVSELALLLSCGESEVLRTSGKTGQGVVELMDAIVERVPAPKKTGEETQALVFDFSYSDHRGVIMYVRIFGGSVAKGDTLKLIAAGATFTALEVGILTPDEKVCAELSEGEIGYIVTGIKKPGVASVGDTVTSARAGTPALAGYEKPTPVIWASVYPESQDDLPLLRQSLERLRLSDSSLSYEEESSGVMGKGYRCGFLGMLHLEIVIERLRREFFAGRRTAIIVTQPTCGYEITRRDGAVEEIYAPAKFPDDDSAERVREMWVRAFVMTPPQHLGGVTQLLYEHEAKVGETETLIGGSVRIAVDMPLRELMRGFFDRLKSVSSGFASLSYELLELRDADVVRLDILVAEEIVPAFSRIVSRQRINREAEIMVERLEKLLPRQLFELKIQAKTGGRIIAARRKSALRKDVTGYLYGGDVTRKMKLLEKQKRGKKKMLARGRVDIPHDVFLKVVRDS